MTTEKTLERIAAALERIADTLDRGTGYATTPEGLPICPKHGAPMKRRQKQGDIWYSHRVIDPATGEEKFCRGYPAGKLGPGWDVVTDAVVAGPGSVTTTPTTQEDAADELDQYFPR